MAEEYYVVPKSEFEYVADKIRVKGSTSASLSWPVGYGDAVQAFPDAVTLDSLSVTENGVYTPSSGHAFSEVTVDVSGGGGDTDVDEIIMRTISGSYTNGTTTEVGTYAFAYCYNLTAVSFSACTSIDSNAFYRCSSLVTAHFPECKTIGNSVFAVCSSLTTVQFPSCTTIGGSAFAYCTSLTSISFPECKTIGDRAFYECTELTVAYFPKCTVIGATAFSHCRRLAVAQFSACTMISVGAFYSCEILSDVNFPECTSIGGSAFYYCNSLTAVSFPKCISIGIVAFRYCSTLYSAYFLGSSVPQIYSNTFSNTPITSTAGTPGSVFVRASMLAAFQSASHWSTFSSHIVGLTDEQIAALDA